MENLQRCQVSSVVEIVPSEYQQAVLNKVTAPGNIFVNAVAGAAKTTTLEMIAKRLPPMYPAIFLAYNKHIQEELSKRLSDNPTLKVYTVHSLGYALIRGFLPNGKEIKVSDQKLEIIYDKTFGIFSDSSKAKKDVTAIIMRSSVLRLARYAKQNGVVPQRYENKYHPIVKNTDEFWNDAVLDLGMTDAMREQCCKMPMHIEFEQYFTLVITRTNELLEKSINDCATIDYDDMLYLPVIMQCKSRWHQYRYLLIDETQDFSAIQMRVVDLVMVPMTKIIGVGDPKQSIYAFRGADSNAIKNFVEKYKCEIMQLPICYRCGKQIVEVAKQYNPIISAYEKNDDGYVVEYESAWTPMMVPNLCAEDMILSRLNKILIYYAIMMIKNKIQFEYVGRDFGSELKSLLNHCKKPTVNDTLLALEDWGNNMMRKYLSAGRQQEASAAVDKKDSLRLLIDYAIPMSSPGTYVEFIGMTLDKIFAKHERDVKAVRLSTIHRSKGLQADRVFLIDFDMLPMKYEDMSSADMNQELNILYVGVTRAKKELHFVRTPDAMRERQYKGYRAIQKNYDYRRFVTKIVKRDGSVIDTNAEQQELLIAAAKERDAQGLDSFSNMHYNALKREVDSLSDDLGLDDDDF